MKIYEKPSLTLLTVSANDTLCSNSCDIKTRGNEDIFKYIDNRFGNGDGLLEPGDSVFASSADDCDFYYQGYCKFSTSDIIFTS